MIGTLSDHRYIKVSDETSVSEHVIKDVDFLARQVAKEGSKYVFWLGAGVSVTAGIPTAAGVVDRLLDKLWRQPGGSHVGEKTATPYASLSEPGRAERMGIVRKWALQNIPEVGTWRAKNYNDDEASITALDWGAFYSTGLDFCPERKTGRSSLSTLQGRKRSP